jgi:hypothetical protein
MTMSNQPAIATADPDPDGWRAAAVRVLANALLVLPAYGVAIIGVGAVRVIVTGAPAGPLEAWLLFPLFLLVRWLYVLPGLLVVLVGIELIARRAPLARVVTLVVASAPMAAWALTQSSPHADISADLAILGLTAVLFAVLARLPPRFPRSAEDRAAAQTPAGTTVASR